MLIFHTIYSWLEAVFTTKIISAVFVLALFTFTPVESRETLSVQCKVLWRKLMTSGHRIFGPLTIPFSQNPFMLWLHPYPEWSRRFFASDDYLTMKERYHTGGTTQYLPCVFALYSERRKYLLCIALIFFLGISATLIQISSNTLPKIDLFYYLMILYPAAITLVYCEKLNTHNFTMIFWGIVAGAIAMSCYKENLSTNPLLNNSDWLFALSFTFPLAMFIIKTEIKFITPLMKELELLTTLVIASPITYGVIHLKPNEKLDHIYIVATLTIMTLVICTNLRISKIKLIRTLYYFLVCIILFPGLACLAYYINPIDTNIYITWNTFISIFYPSWIISSNQKIRKKHKLLILIVFICAFLNTHSIAELTLPSTSSDLPAGLWLYISTLLSLIIVPALPAKTKHTCTDDISRVCIGKLKKEGESNKRLIQEYTLAILSIIFLIFLFSIKLYTLSSDKFQNGQLFNHTYLPVTIIISALLLALTCRYYFTLYKLHQSISKTTSERKMKKDILSKIYKTVGITYLVVSFQSLVAVVSFFKPNMYIYYTLAFLLSISAFLIGYNLYIKPTKDTRNPKAYVLPWISFLLSVIVFLNITPPHKYCIYLYIFALSLPIALLFFYFPKFFHTKGRRDCDNKLEYGIYLWPLGLRAWNLLFGVAMSIPLYLFGWEYALTTLFLITFFIPWFIYSILREPVLLDLWRGKQFYKLYLEAEAAIDPHTRGLVRFWPFRCLPFLPRFTNFRGGQSRKASLYTRIALHEIISSKMPIQKDTETREDNYAFFLSLKWFWFCCVPIWSSFIVLLAMTIVYSSQTGTDFFEQPLNTITLPFFLSGKKVTILGRYIFLALGTLWLTLSYKMVSLELSRLSTLSKYNREIEGQVVVPLWIKAKAAIAARDFEEIFKTQTQKIIKITLGAFASIYCVLLTLG